MGRRRYQNIYWLQKVYSDHDWTQTKIAEFCDVSVRTIGNWVDRYDIRKNRHDPEWLEDKYVKEKLSQREIGELCETGSSTIGDQLRKFGISRERNYRKEAWLREKYEDEELTLREIGELVGVGSYAIRYWLIEYGIERRDSGRRSRNKENDTDGARLARWSRKVKERDGYECVSCSSTQNLHSHHIVPRYEDQSEESVYGLENGETLCRSCHAKRHRERGDDHIAVLIRHSQ